MKGGVGVVLLRILKDVALAVALAIALAVVLSVALAVALEVASDIALDYACLGLIIKIRVASQYRTKKSHV